MGWERHYQGIIPTEFNFLAASLGRLSKTTWGFFPLRGYLPPPPPLLNNVKKNCIIGREGHPLPAFSGWRWRWCAYRTSQEDGKYKVTNLYICMNIYLFRYFDLTNSKINRSGEENALFRKHVRLRYCQRLMIFMIVFGCTSNRQPKIRCTFVHLFTLSNNKKVLDWHWWYGTLDSILKFEHSSWV